LQLNLGVGWTEQVSLMDVCAELTLRIVRAAQEALNPRSSLVGWFFFPAHRQISWSDANQALASASKPLIVAPLVEPGSIAVWSIDTLESSDRKRLEYEFANQRQYFREKLEMLGLNDSDHVETPDGEFRVTVAEFRGWSAEYSIPIGIGMSRSPTPNTARLLIRPPGGGGPPVGWIDVRRPANEEL